MSYMHGNQGPGGTGNSPRNMSGKRKLIGVGIVGLVILIVFVVVSGDSDVKPWLDDHYQHISGTDPDDHPVVYHSDDDAQETATDIITGTDPDDQFEAGTFGDGVSGPVYLRYDADWIVAVEDDGNDGARITLEEFDRGYRRAGVLPVFWSNYYGRGSSGIGGSGFRGGGGGFGK